MRVRVIGVGTRRGDDAAGLDVAEALAGEPLPDGVRVQTCERPGPELALVFADCDALVLVDATRCGLAPGTVHRPPAAALARAARLSTHAFGVAEALALADALGRRPPRVEIVGIEAADAATAGEPSRPVRDALPRATALAREIAVELSEAP